MIFFILAHSILAASVNLMFSYLSLSVCSEVFEFYVRFLLPGCRKRCGFICIIWFVWKLKEEKTCEEFRCMVRDKVEEVKWKGLGVNDHWQQMKGIMMETAQDICGMTKGPPRPFHFTSSTLSPTMHLNSSHVFSSLSFHTRTLSFGSAYHQPLYILSNNYTENYWNRTITFKLSVDIGWYTFFATV